MFLNPAISLLKDNLKYTEASLKELHEDMAVFKAQCEDRARRIVSAEERRAAYIDAIRRLEQ